VISIEASLVNPQRWNRYQYALNNPARYIDPDGNDPRGTLATLGEKLAEYHLRNEGYTIVLTAARKAYNQGGVDTVARRGTETLVIDNKAYLTRGTASSASALVENLEKNIAKAVLELQERLESRSLSAAERTIIEQTVSALESRSYQRVITGAGGMVGRVGGKLAAAGVAFKGLGSVAGALAFVATEAYFAEGVGGFESDVTLTREEEALYGRYKAGEDIFGQDGDRQ
jgi:Holliday junction resolvase-like predicted endonuclease